MPPPALALLLLVAGPALAGAAAPPAPPPAPPPAAPLLVLRAACGAGDAAAFERRRLVEHARRGGRVPPPGGFRVLGYTETCGASWPASVSRAVLAALAGGGGAAAAGWPGAPACAALGAPAAALRRPRPAPCVRPAARAAAVAALALRLHWRRASLPPEPPPAGGAPRAGGPAGECAVSLQRAALALAAAGLAVSRAPLHSDELNHPDVVILCACARGWPAAARASVRAVLLLAPARPPGQGAPAPATDSDTTLGPLVSNVSATDDCADEYYIPSKFSFNSPPILLLADGPVPNSRRFSLHEVYGEALEALESHERSVRAGNETHRATFQLYENRRERWSRVAAVQATLTRSLSEVDFQCEVAVSNATMDFDEWCALWARGEEPAWGWPRAGAAGAALLGGALAAAAWRAAARRRRGRRRRRDVVLNPEDFTFPPDERRVAPGMESMLSCWLQQFHEFGGPDLEKPDLLQQPPPPSVPSSSTSVNRVADTRVRYKGEPVHLKWLPAPPALELRRRAIDVLLVMQGLRHENINRFIGILCSPRPALVAELCGRGSLQDVLRADGAALDWPFRLALLADAARGLRALHAGPLRAHGRLSSRACAVGARWALRLAGCGEPAFRRAQGLPPPRAEPRDLLWTAPELLREMEAERRGGAGEGGGEPRATQAGDIFAFGIIMQEVIVRGEPYCMLPLTPDEIIEKLRRPPPLCRPSVPLSAAPPEVIGLMRQCWAEAADARPSADRVDQLFQQLHKGRKINIVDSMFEMLEKYSNNLEELIRERTAQLDTEKRKTEQLLNRMLPRSVAERLVRGERVEPEEFEEVSIYFSDIVGFTELAARSTPVEVVALLNDLYTTFDAAIEQYDVYKVETIGDAYMVVGGLPARSRSHAPAVATMALHLLHLAGRFTVRHRPRQRLLLRIGLHSGPCCAGVVGLTMPRYCLFGDTVNTASRMESTGAAWRIQVSAATAALLAAAGGYRLRSRGLTQVKGKGAMHTYWLLGKDGFDKPLPTPPPLETEDALLEHEAEFVSEDTPAEPEPAAPPPPGRARGWPLPSALSADSSPPAAPPYSRYRFLGGAGGGGGMGALRRQWSLERPEELASLPAPAPRGRSRDADGRPPREGLASEETPN